MSDILLRFCCRLVFAAHLVIPAAYLWVSPKGFAFSHSRFWLNVALPTIVMLVAVWGWWGVFKERMNSAAAAILLFSSGWIGGAIAGRVFFPHSLRGFWALGLAIAVCGLLLCWFLSRRESLQRYAFALVPFCAVAGAFSVWAQVPPVPSTRPMELDFPQFTSQSTDTSPTAFDVGTKQAAYNPTTSQLSVSLGNLDVRCFPRLRFDRISADGFWSLLAPPNKVDDRLTERESLSATRERYAYRDQTAVEIFCEPVEGTIECTAWSTLSVDTYSHLNSFAVFVIDGHNDLSLAFSPCPDIQVEVMPSDYPVGRPARLTYLTKSEKFVVAEATSGEKGPFHELAAGPLKRGESLTISLYDDGHLVGTITLEDWTAQLSTDLSPSAGWSVPMNSIEFRRANERSDSSVEIHFTLAATSVGRGWESVGHRAGTYRNRIRFEVVDRQQISQGLSDDRVPPVDR